MINICVVFSFMNTLLVFVTHWKYFPTLTTVVIITYAPFSLESKRSKRFGIIIFVCNSVMNLAAAEHSSSPVFGSFGTTSTGVGGRDYSEFLGKK